MPSFTVIGFGTGESERDADFIKRISDATLESLLLLASMPEKMALAPIIHVRRVRGEDRSFGHQGTQYSSVYYLNEPAALMCRELGLSLPFIGEADSMPDEASYEMQAHYLPADER